MSHVVLVASWPWCRCVIKVRRHDSSIPKLPSTSYIHFKFPCSRCHAILLFVGFQVRPGSQAWGLEKIMTSSRETRITAKDVVSGWSYYSMSSGRPRLNRTYARTPNSFFSLGATHCSILETPYRVSSLLTQEFRFLACALYWIPVVAS